MCFSTTLAEKPNFSLVFVEDIDGVAVDNRGGDNMGIAWVLLGGGDRGW